MTNSYIYPNITWPQFSVCNDDQTGAFEDMCRQLFEQEYLKGQEIPHSDPNNPGIEVNPILEPSHEDGSLQRWISFQAKYFENSISYAQIKDSAEKTVKYYTGKLDVVYLFCNKSLNTTSKAYIEIKETLSSAGIELIPISDSELLDLVRKYKSIGDYYFQNRIRANDSSNFSGITTAIPNISFSSSESGTTIFIPSTNTLNSETNADNKLIKELISEKVADCRSAIIDLKLKNLRTELDKLFKYNLNDFQEKETLYFYRFLLALHNGDDNVDILNAEIHMEKYKHDADWLVDYWNMPNDISFDTFVGFQLETQIFVLDILFAEQLWNCILTLNREALSNCGLVSDGVKKQLTFYYGLSCFNLANYDDSCKAFSELFDTYHETKIQFLLICAQIQKTNAEFRYGDSKQNENLRNLIRKLSEIKKDVSDQVEQNEVLIAAIELQSYYNLGVEKRSFLQQANECYNSYSENVRNNETIKILIGMCYALNGETDNAIAVYSSMDWKNNEEVAVRRSICLIQKGEYDKAVRDYSCIDQQNRTPQIIGVYLLALSHIDNVAYHHELEETIQKIGESISDLYAVAFYVEDTKLFYNLVVPKIEELLQNDKKIFTSVDESVKKGFLVLFAAFDQIPLISVLLESITNFETINEPISYDIYSALFRIANKEYTVQRNNEELKNDLHIVEQIADRFVSENKYPNLFLQIKVLCAGAQRMNFSMLKYSKELFEYTHDVETARLVVGLLFERNEINPKAYEPYLDVLRKSAIPDHSMVVASAFLRLGRDKEADFYAYKALYLLNGEDDFNIYKSYFNFYHYYLQRYKHEGKKTVITDNMIVRIKKQCVNQKKSGGHREKEKSLVYCLDSESDFADENNCSLGIRHINKRNTLYAKLLDCHVGQIITIEGKDYKISSFMPREHYAINFIYKKIQEYPDEFNDCIWFIKAEDTQEMVEQIKKYTSHTDWIEKLLSLYNFSDNSTGIPIDTFVHGEYDRYIDVLRMLLFEPDQAFYAGQPFKESLKDYYVPTLSTLVILSIIDKLSVLDVISDRIIIPESYIEFFQERYIKEQRTQAVSFGTLVTSKDGNIAMIDPDRSIPAIWESLVNLCETYKKAPVTDDERIKFVIAQNTTAEELFSKLNFDKIQIDALIVSTREKAVYLCDDLFFRKLASFMGIQNTNFVSLLYHYEDLNYVVPILLQLSKTNYIYTPFMYRNNEDAQELLKNLTTGEKKRKLYSDFLHGISK